MTCEPEYNYDGTILSRLPEEYDGMFEVPEGVTEIADCAFMDCQSLSAISLPSTLTKIVNYGEQITEKFAKEYSYKSSVGHKKLSETELDELYANKIPVDYALQDADENQVYFGDYYCAMHYATRGSRSSVAILIEAKMSLNELNVDGTDSLAFVFDSENNNPILRKVFGNKIDLYLEKLRAETTSTDEESTRRIRKAVLNMAQSDNDIVYEFYKNDLLIHGKQCTVFKYALQAKLPIAPEKIVSVRIVHHDADSAIEGSKHIGLGDMR